MENEEIKAAAPAHNDGEPEAATESTEDGTTEGAESKAADNAKPAPDPDETTARHNGWVPKSEWEASGKPPEAWHDAKTHNIRAAFIGDLNKQRREIDDLKSITREMGVHNQRLNVAHKRQLAELEATLKARRNEAIIEGDDARADKLEAELNGVRQEANEITRSEAERVAAARQHPAEKPIFQAWVKENDWWHTDSIKRERALGIGAIMSNTPEGRAMSEEAFLDEVSRRINATAPESEQSRKTQAVESGKGRGGNGNGGKKLSRADLTPGELRAMKGFVDNNTLTEDQYLAEVAEMRKQ